MFLTLRFFLVLAALALVSVAGFYWPPCYEAAQWGVGVVALLVAADAVALRAGVRVRAARRCRDRFDNAEDNDVRLRIDNLCRLPLRLTVRDELPPAFRYHDAVFALRLRGGEGKTVHYALRPTERGGYGFGHVLLFVRTPLGLLERKVKGAWPQKVKVYPAYERLAQYELAAAGTELTPHGRKPLRRAGCSTEYDQIRDYVTGDDYRTLNWKASARAGRWMVNTYTDERAQPVWCLIDKGRIMQRTRAHVTLLDYAVNAALALSYVALQRDDMAGLVTFADAIDTTVPAARRPGQLQTLLEALYAQATRYAEADYEALALHLSRTVRSRSLLVLFTDFASPDHLRRSLPSLRRLAANHCLLVIFFADEAVERLASAPADSLQSQRLRTLAADHCLSRRGLVATLRQCGIHTLLTTPGRLTVDAINKYLTLKRQGAV